MIIYTSVSGISEVFHAALNTICFEYLSRPHRSDMPIDGMQRFYVHVPYLNGGLFRNWELSLDTGEVKESHLQIKNFQWHDLLSEFNKYHWAIHNHSDNEKTDVIGTLTPRILGHIYERFVISVSRSGEIKILEDLKTTNKGDLLKGNKKMGGYYTSERMTRYIADNTIFPCVAD
ncbi:MAG: hypothetical protein ACOC38_05860 [Promethearchaeia archaeon]